MRTFLTILFALHGLIHLLGFAKAFQLASITQLTQPISRPLGLLWLASSALFISGAAMYALKLNLWWAPAILAIILSQTLIFMFWQDAKFGTIANLIVLVCVALGFGTWNLQKKKMAELSELLPESAASQTISEEALKGVKENSPPLTHNITYRLMDIYKLLLYSFFSTLYEILEK